MSTTCATNSFHIRPIFYLSCSERMAHAIAFGLSPSEVKLRFVTEKLTTADLEKFPLILVGQNISNIVKNNAPLFSPLLEAGGLLESKSTKFGLLANGTRLAIVPVASDASRHNCVARPDSL